MKPLKVLLQAARVKDIVAILARHGFANFLTQIDLPSGMLEKFLPDINEGRSIAERIRLAAEELGPTFIKIGQLMSMRPDVFPHDLVTELRKLQDNVRPLPFDRMRPVLESSLGSTREAVFSRFDEEPIAAASLAQVYFAELGDGTPVAVKIQKPELLRSLEPDLELALWFAKLLHDRIPTLQPYDLPAILSDSRDAILRELDYRNEARNQEFFNAQNPSPTQVFAPRVYLNLSTERVLVTERVTGKPAYAGSSLPPDLGEKLAGAGAKSLLRQVFIDGFFHADPHAGNLLITEDQRLCFLDWGLAGHLTRRLRTALADFWVAAVEQDAERIVQLGADLAPVDARPDLRAIEKEVTLVLREELNFSVGRQALGRALLRLLYVFGKHGIPLSRDYALMAKAVVSIEEVGRILSPHFDLKTHAELVVKELNRERINSRILLRRSSELIRNALHDFQDVPFGLRRLLKRLEHDNLAITLNHRGLEQHDSTIKTAANRIALALIIGSLVVGSSLIVITGIKPYIFGYPALGIVGYLLSAVLGLYVVWDIIGTGKSSRKTGS